jgi:hypothetical protein
MERGAELREKLDLARHATKIAGRLQTREAVEQLTEAVYRLVECVDMLAEGTAVDVHQGRASTRASLHGVAQARRGCER